MFVLLTGTRKGEASGLTWEGVDFEGKTLTFYDTKNGSYRTIPITLHLGEILERRKEQAAGSEYVFPSERSKSGHITDMNRTRDRVREAADFSMHDLRRTYATVLESLEVSQMP